MTIIQLNLEHPSRYDNAIPYTYEARYRSVDGVEDCSNLEGYSGYFSGTICGLLRILRILGYEPHTVDLYEIYRDREVEIAPDMYIRHGKWLTGNDLCQSFKKIYPDHIGSDSCRFDDRNLLGAKYSD